MHFSLRTPFGWLLCWLGVHDWVTINTTTSTLVGCLRCPAVGQYDWSHL